MANNTTTSQHEAYCNSMEAWFAEQVEVIASDIRDRDKAYADAEYHKQAYTSQLLRAEANEAQRIADEARHEAAKINFDQYLTSYSDNNGKD